MQDIGFNEDNSVLCKYSVSNFTLKKDKNFYILDFYYFYKSIFFFINKILHKKDNNVNEGDDHYAKMCFNGSMLYKHIDQVKVEKEISKKNTDLLFGNTNYKIDNYQCEKFEAFIKLLILKGINVHLYLPPYHPKKYAFLIDLFRNLLKLIIVYPRNKIKSQSKSLPAIAIFIGSYSKSLNFSNHMFI